MKRISCMSMDPFVGGPIRGRGLLRLRAVWLMLTSLVGTLPAPAALPPEQPYLFRVWQTEDGLPLNSVSAVLQTRDGYLWICTYNGLARFDGARFTVFNERNTPELRDSRVTRLFEDAEENLWIGHETGELTRYHQGRFEAMEMPAGWKNRTIEAIASDETGAIWLANSDRLLMRLADKTELTPMVGKMSDGITLTRDQRGQIWVCRGGRVSLLKSGRLEPVDFDGSIDKERIQAITTSRHGGIWLVSDGRLKRWANGAWAADLGQSPWNESDMVELLESQSGALVAATSDHGLYVISPKRRVIHLSQADGFPSDWLRKLCEDREGNWWVSAANGLIRVRASEATTVSPPDHWQGRAVLSVAVGSRGTLWLGTEGAGLYRLDHSGWQQFGRDDGISNLFVWSVCEDAVGRIWLGTWGGGLFIRESDRFQQATGAEGIQTPVVALLPSRTGGLWAGTGAGLLQLNQGRAILHGEEAGLRLPRVCAVLEESPSRLWFGMAGGGLGCLENGKVRQLGKQEGLPSDFVWCLHLDRDGTLWIGTSGGGLSRLKQGRFATISARQGLPNDVICHIEDDGRGHFWLGTHGGIVRVSKEELNRCADGLNDTVSCRTYGKVDGLPTLECSGGAQPSGCQTADGRLWFATSRGLVCIDPGQVRTNQLAPPVLIEELRVEGRSVTTAGRPEAATGSLSSSPVAAPPSPVRISPGHHRFEFFYTALSFVVPEKVRFKYKLEGLDQEWLDVGNTRQAAYPYIPPGDYRFRVIACNNDGVWNEEGATLDLTVLPHFWQTAWFEALVGGFTLAAVGGGVWFVTRRRLRSKLQRVERERTVERERARIARDLHDRIGAGLTRINYLGQRVHRNIDSPERATPDVDQLQNTARELTREMDEIVWAVNPQHDTLDSLATYLGNFAQEYLRVADVRCRLDFPLELPAWPLTSEVRHNLFLAFKEVLHNTLKHAAATQVSLSLRLEPAGFTLTVEDDGRGIPMDQSAPGHLPAQDRFSPGNGLANMRLRLSEIGGRVNLWSEMGKGTRIIFVVPVQGITA